MSRVVISESCKLQHGVKGAKVLDYLVQGVGAKLDSSVSPDKLLGVFRKLVSVMERDSVTLHTNITEICEDGDLLWKFGAENTLIAEITREATHDGPDGRFRDRLKLDNLTGSLTITNITTQHDGLYQVEITAAKLSSKTFSVSVYGG
ncbi:Signal-regulatory protein beta-1 isoform 3 [Labeo rohita]|uniref:Signal-regulatory protein beta-1 isoform 3 n=1 Tax=Labeo rohita TaxID=84645 RepID=A0ABQ8L5K2_LABRO|nr:Signal-regulatory protein beta-1 isoform 3 [Labeo rohita]